WQGIGALSALIFCVLLLTIFSSSLININKLTYEHKVVVLSAITSFFTTSILIILSGTQRHTRYLLPSLIAMLPIVAVYLSNTVSFRRRIFSCIFVSCLILQSVSLSFANNIPQTDYKAAAQWLERSGYTQGISSFPNSAPITEFSNGKIDIYSMMAREDSGCLIMRKTNWVQRKSKLQHDPAGKIFLLLSDKERTNDKAHIYADDKHLVYSYRGLNIYDYPSYNAMLNNILNKNILPNGNILCSKEELSGFNVTLLPGKYYLQIDCQVKQEIEGKLSLFQLDTINFSIKDGRNKIPVEVCGGEPILVDIYLQNDTINNVLVKSISFSQFDN
ncbi:hypothetical protein IJT10_07755, partial [bacterium]|nr:hypothetical protein [bacterium]